MKQQSVYNKVKTGNPVQQNPETTKLQLKPDVNGNRKVCVIEFTR